jgi:protein TonB
VAAAVYRDDPWRRVLWLLPTAAALTLLSLMGFLKLLAGAPFVTPLLPAVEVDVVELAPNPPLARAPPAPPPPREPPPLALEPPPLPQSSSPATPEPAGAQALPAPPLAPHPEPPVARVKPPPQPPQRAAPTQKSVPSVQSPPLADAPPSPALTPPVASLPPSGSSMGARALYRPLPEIPEELRWRAIDLMAVARFHVAASGSAEVELIQPTPDATLNRALLETLKKWRFFPAMESGKPQASTIDIRIPITVR